MKGSYHLYEDGLVSLDDAKEVLEEGVDAIQWVDKRGERRIGLVLKVDDRALPSKGRLKILVDSQGELHLITYEKGSLRDGIFIVMEGGDNNMKELSDFIAGLRVKSKNSNLIAIRDELARLALGKHVRDVDPAIDGRVGVECIHLVTKGHAPTMYLEKVERVKIDFENPGDLRSLASITDESGKAKPGIVVYKNHRYLVSLYVKKGA